MVDLIAKSLPKGWHVYVKEHPTQFTPSKYFRSQSGRFKFMYDDISALTNVSLVPMAVNSFDLIDSAQAVAVVTGTTGWEAIHRGKPVLVFGFPWYRGCEGTFHVDTREKCEAALRKIYNGYQIDSQKRRLFVYALEQTGIEAFVEPHLRVASISDGENAKRLADALQKI
jgi:capsule polysaccharide export protein KpsC/LpsZ